MLARATLALPGVPMRLKIRNGCSREPIWIAHEAGADIGIDEQNVKIMPDETFAFMTPAGLSATRYWPKMGCDDEGDHCNLGGSGGPGESCVRRPPEVKEDDYSRCAPPVDTKFEATFDAGGFDFVDMSLVDGWTLPFTLKLSGGECTGRGVTDTSLTIDCSGLSFAECPQAERLSGRSMDLRAINPHTKEVAGCYAPCMKLVSGKWGNNASHGRKHEDPEVAPYCCPTPPKTPEECRAGPITQTNFLQAVHTKCPGVYGYAYDDGMGLLKCTPDSEYELTFFCPDARTSWPSTSTLTTASRTTSTESPSRSSTGRSTTEPTAVVFEGERERRKKAQAAMLTSEQAAAKEAEEQAAAMAAQSAKQKAQPKTAEQAPLEEKETPPWSEMLHSTSPSQRGDAAEASPPERASSPSNSGQQTIVVGAPELIPPPPPPGGPPPPPASPQQVDTVLTGKKPPASASTSEAPVPWSSPASASLEEEKPAAETSEPTQQHRQWEVKAETVVMPGSLLSFLQQCSDNSAAARAALVGSLAVVGVLAGGIAVLGARRRFLDVNNRDMRMTPVMEVEDVRVRQSELRSLL